MPRNWNTLTFGANETEENREKDRKREKERERANIFYGILKWHDRANNMGAK